MDAEPPGPAALPARNVIPHARGLGSSSAAIVGRALAGPRAGRRRPAAARRRRGLPARGRHRGASRQRGAGVLRRLRDLRAATTARFYAVRLAVDPRIGAVVFVPPDPVSTELARGLLPAEVPHADAAANAGRTALLVAALAGQPEHLLAGHPRLPAPGVPRAGDAGVARPVDALRADGVPAVVSGAGPTVLAFTTAAGRRREALLARCPAGWAGAPAGRRRRRGPPRLTPGRSRPWPHFAEAGDNLSVRQ